MYILNHRSLILISVLPILRWRRYLLLLQLLSVILREFKPVPSVLQDGRTIVISLYSFIHGIAISPYTHFTLVQKRIAVSPYTYLYRKGKLFLRILIYTEKDRFIQKSKGFYIYVYSFSQRRINFSREGLVSPYTHLYKEE